jgi:hypothetical protein
MMFKFLWVTGQKRLDKMTDLEEKLSVLLPDVPKQMDTLRSIADSLLKVELGRWALMRGGYIPETEPPEPGSLAEKVSKLDQVDRNLIVAAWGHVMDMFEDKALELQAEQDRKKNDANPEKKITINPRYKMSVHLPAINVSRYRRSHRLPTINVARYGRNQHLSALNVRR